MRSATGDQSRKRCTGRANQARSGPASRPARTWDHPHRECHDRPMAKKKKRPAPSLSELLAVGPGFDLSATDTGATPGFDGGKKKGEQALAAGGEHLSDLQERLTAAAKG